MLKYAQIANEETKEVSVGLGTNTDFYKSIGMVEMEVEQAYNGLWYLQGSAPAKPQSVIDEERISELKKNLADTDYVTIKIAEGVSTREDYVSVLQQRQQWREELERLGV
jgi:hypothetical protein